MVLTTTCKDRSTMIKARLRGQNHDIEVQYVEISGNGPPPGEMGSPGDIYIDISSKPYEFYGRMPSNWSKLRKPMHDVVHPLWPNLHLDHTTGLAPIWVEMVPGNRIRLSNGGNNNHDHNQRAIKMVTKSGNNQPNQKRGVTQVDVPNPDRVSKKAKHNDRVNPVKPPAQTTSFSFQEFLKTFRVRAIPPNFTGNFIPSGYGAFAIHFSQFWSFMLPPTDFGCRGDMFFVVSKFVHSVFIKTDTWIQWKGVSSLLSTHITHPDFPDMVVSFTGEDIVWAAHKDPLVKCVSGPVTAEECVHTMLRNTSLKSSLMIGVSVSHKAGGSPLYLKMEHERLDARCEKLVRENSHLKKQVADARVAFWEDLIKIGPRPDRHILLKMKEALSCNTNFRNFVMSALEVAPKSPPSTSYVSQQVQTDPGLEATGQTAVSQRQRTREPHISLDCDIPPNHGAQQKSIDRERHTSYDALATVQQEKLVKNTPVVTSVNQGVEQIAPLESNKITNSVSFDNAVLSFDNSDVTTTNVPKDQGGIPAPNNGSKKASEKDSVSDTSEFPSSPISNVGGSPRKEKSIQTLNSVEGVLVRSVADSSESAPETSIPETEGSLPSGVDIPSQPVQVSSSPQCDTNDLPPATKDLAPVEEEDIKQEPAEIVIHPESSASYLSVLYHVLEASKSRVCRLCLQLSPPQVVRFNANVLEHQLIRHSKEKHGEMYRILENMSPEQLSAVHAKVSAVSQQTMTHLGGVSVSPLL